MSDDNRKEFERHFNEAMEAQQRMKRKITDNTRMLTLMEAGLESRPLDRDFFERIKDQFDHQAKDFRIGESLLRTMKQALESGADIKFHECDGDHDE